MTHARSTKATLPAKTCAACGRPMGWRKRWAKNWSEVTFGSAACRKRARHA